MLRLAGFILSFGFLPVSTWAQSVGVVYIKGDVKAGPSGQLSPIKLGSRVQHGHVLKTGAGSSVIVTFPSESRMKINEKTELTIQAPADPKEQTGADLVVGAVFSLVRKTSTPNFQVKTPTAVAGVRGTQFFTSHDAKTARTWTCVKEGEVEMTSGTEEPVAVPAGLGVLVEKGKRIEPPKKYKWTEKLNWNMDAEAGEVIDRTQIEYDILRKNYD